MEREERLFLGVLVLVALAFNAVTLSPLVPWQQWTLWSRPAPTQKIQIEMGDYQFNLPAEGIQVKANQFVEFAVTSTDVTYGLGVFRQDGTLVFQMQVLPGYVNQLTWKFDTPGTYDFRSTEYSGPRHSDMVVRGALHVIP